VRLRERLAVYDRFIGPEWIDAALLSRVKAMRRALDSAAECNGGSRGDGEVLK
jgi:hypothetical protein